MSLQVYFDPGEIESRVRSILGERYDERVAELQKEHRELPKPNSPDWEYVERFYRHKIASGRMTLRDAIAKIKECKGFLEDVIIQHIIEHIALRPFSESEVQAAMQEEFQKEAVQEARQTEKATADLRKAFHDLLRQIERRAKRQEKRRRKEGQRVIGYRKERVRKKDIEIKSAFARLKAYVSSAQKKNVPRKQERRLLHKIEKTQQRIKSLQNQRTEI